MTSPDNMSSSPESKADRQTPRWRVTGVKNPSKYVNETTFTGYRSPGPVKSSPEENQQSYRKNKTLSLKDF